MSTQMFSHKKAVFGSQKSKKGPISTSEGPPIFIFDGKTFSNLNSFDDLNDFGRFFS